MSVVFDSVWVWKRRGTVAKKRQLADGDIGVPKGKVCGVSCAFVRRLF